MANKQIHELNLTISSLADTDVLVATDTSDSSKTKKLLASTIFNYISALLKYEGDFVTGDFTTTSGTSSLVVSQATHGKTGPFTVQSYELIDSTLYENTSDVVIEVDSSTWDVTLKVDEFSEFNGKILIRV